MGIASGMDTAQSGILTLGFFIGDFCAKSEDSLFELVNV
jgi:hypothetical protein